MEPAKFELGQTVATPGALRLLEQAGIHPADLLRRHHTGDWGDTCEEDADLNEQAVRDGSRIFSVYKLDGGEKVWVITEAEDDTGRREATTILLPDEY